jgi:hypothetical protein
MVRDKSPQALIVGVSSKDSGNEQLIAAGANTICKKSEFTKLSATLSTLLLNTTDR